jgi:hypothetical protein
MNLIELSNTIDKNRASLNAHPGSGGPGGDFAQHESKESAQFVCPFAVENGQIHIDAPLAVMRPEGDQLPGSCKNWLPVGRWIDVANVEYGVTCATLDAPLVEVGSLSATMLGSQTHPEVWRKHIEPTQTFYSWVINNHWGTNYRAYQDGLIEFRYPLRPHAGYDLQPPVGLQQACHSLLYLRPRGSDLQCHSSFTSIRKMCSCRSASEV